MHRILPDDQDSIRNANQEIQERIVYVYDDLYTGKEVLFALLALFGPAICIIGIFTLLSCIF